MNYISRFRSLGLILALGGAVSSAFAGAPSNCDKIAQDVRESVTKQPSKVLMIVEDALVINESCACEIIKAAITAANADTPMVKKIVETAVAVAPKMTPIIVECSNAVAPGAVTAEDAPVVANRTGKGAKNVQPGPIQPATDTGVDYSYGAFNSLRGVYLMAPAVGGSITEVKTVIVTRETRTSGRRKRQIIPLSPSNAMPGWVP